MRNIKLIIEFDGTNYCGWQKQKDNITIQGEIEKAISRLTKEEIEIFGSSRTDAGVHARAMVANFKTKSSIPAENFRDAINSKLPKDISIIKSEEADIDFHSRYDSVGKTYCYSIINRRERVSIMRNYCYQVKYSLDLEAMNKACTYFIGEHDFKAFRTLGSSAKTSVRTIKELYIEKKDDRLNIYVTADGFLYNMVRIIVGTLLKVGRGRIKADDLEEIIKSGDRGKAGPCVPSSGLCLEKVYFEKINF